MNLKSKIALAVVALTAGSAAMAQLSFNVGAVSDYRVRGIAQTAYEPSVQGGVDYAHSSGFYAGAWAATNLKWIKDFNQSTKGDYEIDLYGGYKGEIKSAGLNYDVGAITYQYPDNNSGAAGTPGAGSFSNATTYEFYGALTYNIFTVKYNQSVGDFLGNLNSNGSRYWDLSANFDLGNGYSLVPHVGRQTIPNQSSATKTGNAADYNDVALTLNKDFGNGITALVAYQSTDAEQNFYTDSKGKFLGKSVWLAGVKYTF
jgi:uncharacterized protein (TIGR02001 family)